MITPREARTICNALLFAGATIALLGPPCAADYAEVATCGLNFGLSIHLLLGRYLEQAGTVSRLGYTAVIILDLVVHAATTEPGPRATTGALMGLFTVWLFPDQGSPSVHERASDVQPVVPAIP